MSTDKTNVKKSKLTLDELRKLIPILQAQFDKLAQTLPTSKLELPCPSSLFDSIKHDIYHRNGGLHNMTPFLTTPDEALQSDDERFFNTHEGVFTQYYENVRTYLKGYATSNQTQTQSWTSDFINTIRLYCGCQRSFGIPTDFNIMTRLAAGRVIRYHKNRATPDVISFNTGLPNSAYHFGPLDHAEQFGAISGLADATMDFKYVDTNGITRTITKAVKEVKDFLTTLAMRIYGVEWFYTEFQQLREKVEQIAGLRGLVQGPWCDQLSLKTYDRKDSHKRDVVNVMSFLEGRIVNPGVSIPSFDLLAQSGYIDFVDLNMRNLTFYNAGSFDELVAELLARLQFAIIVAQVESINATAEEMKTVNTVPVKHAPKAVKSVTTPKTKRKPTLVVDAHKNVT